MMIPSIKYPRYSHRTARVLLTLLPVITMLLATHVANAETLKDPTQPPASLYNHVGDAEDATLAVLPVLQSVMIGHHYRAAIINGKKVLLGGKYEQATLIKLNEYEAVLRNADMSTQTLVMDFAIEKKILVPAVAPVPAKALATKRNNNRPVKSE